MNVTVLLFEDFETLDVFGPVEIFGRLREHYSIIFCSLNGGLVSNNHGFSIPTKELSAQLSAIDIFLIPGGYGTRKEINNKPLIDLVKTIVTSCKYVLTVCTGASLLAKTGLLDGKNTTTNKIAFNWVKTTGKKVLWNAKARWVVDGKFYTSSGVTAGMDMTLAFIQKMHGIETAKRVAVEIEYCWIQDSGNDPFAVLIN